MATINSLLFLFSTLAPNVEPPGNYPVTQAPSKWVQNSASHYGQNAPVLTQMNCGLAEALQCSSHCQKNCSNFDRTIPCPDICVLGCVCIDPFIRGPDGSCIMPYECPANPIISDTTEEPVNIHCNPEEEISHFPHCQRNCSNFDDIIVCPDAGDPGCVCKSPKIRGPDGSCIRPDQCPRRLFSPQELRTNWNPGFLPDLPKISCKENEELSLCVPICPDNCYNYQETRPCKRICLPGCKCKQGFLKNKEGTCIKIEDCEEKKPHECTDLEDYNECGSYCETDCYNYNITDRKCEAKQRCKAGCFCKSGLVRSENGDCIPTDRCPIQSTSNWGMRILKSSDEDADDPSNMKCPPKEEVSCFSHCQANCTTYDMHVNCPMFCVPGCVCIPPMIRGPDGACVMPEQCPAMEKSAPKELRTNWNPGFLPDLPKITCKENEELSLCVPICPDNCYNYQETRPCKRICLPGCKCKQGFLKNKEGICIKIEDCEEKKPYECTDLEDYNKCGSKCETDCYNYNITDRKCEDSRCKAGCFCKSGLVRSENGDCIPTDRCPIQSTSNWGMRILKNSDDDDDDPSDMKCPPKEEVSCFSHCQPNCTTYDKYVNCPMFCVQGCVCIPPLIRGPDGACIMPEQCPAMEKSAPKGSQCVNPLECSNYNEEDEDDDTYKKALSGFLASDEICSENEDYKECGTACQKNCDNYDKIIPCTMNCVSGCFCKEPMIRGPHGKCIQKEECPEKPNDDCPMDEEFKICGTACQKNCQNYDKHFPCEFKCEPGCFCKEPMIRGPSGRCIYKEECPEKLNESTFAGVVCSENEEYRVCGTACQKNCQNYDKNIPCEFKCESGCFCKEPMIRGPGGKCIYKDECPTKTNESEQKMKNRNAGILPDWPKFTCKLNEEFSFCANLCPDNCDNYEEFRICKQFCVPACKCIDGYVKNKHGVCIKKEDCEKKIPVECTELEDYNECGSYCETDCYNYNDTDRKCDIRCKTGCFCKSGLVRSPDGKCIPPNDCPVHVPSKSNWVKRFLKRKQHP